MKSLRAFLEYGRSAFRHGGIWLENESESNALARNLSLMTDTELLQIMAEADTISLQAKVEYDERDAIAKQEAL